MELCGIDFTSAPSRRKPILIARGCVQAHGVRLQALEAIETFAAFERWLCRPGPWLGVFDAPFGLPRSFIETQQWPPDWAAIVSRVACANREDLRARFRAYCDARPAGMKFAHRQTDRPAGASPSMKWVNPPVAWMFKELAPRLLGAGVMVPALHVGDPDRIALEGYPGMLARSLGRVSYKSDSASGRTPARARQRGVIAEALRAGALLLGTPVQMDDAMADALVADPSADRLDAVLCLSAARWAWDRRESGYGLPDPVDPLEGWIVGAVAPAAPAC